MRFGEAQFGKTINLRNLNNSYQLDLKTAMNIHLDFAMMLEGSTTFDSKISSLMIWKTQMYQLLQIS